MTSKLVLVTAAAALVASGCASTENEATATADPMPNLGAEVMAGTAEDFLRAVGDDPRVYFDFDQYNLRADAMAALETQAEWLNTHTDVNILVAGNCDERGTQEYNLALGARRATAVKDFLVARGVAPSRITTISYGKERPVAEGSNEAAWARNRNGHTQILDGSPTS